ncbi:MAG TPA: hypothetical protein VGH14_16850 [Solirubrobacterales bacterium]
MLRGLVAGAALTISVLMMGSAQAASAPRGESESARVVLGASRDHPIPSPGAIVLRGTHGYRITVDANRGAPGHPGQVEVHTEGPGGEVRYEAPARVSDEGIRASLGRFGRIDLRWVPDGRVSEIGFSCHGHAPKRSIFFEGGAYVGRLSIRGGDDFTAVHRKRIEWRAVWYRGASTCRREGGESIPGPGEILEAEDRGSGGATAQRFFLYQPKRGARVWYSATETEVRGPMEIERSTWWTHGRPRTLAFSPDFAAAAVEPPAPFSGTASFARTKGAHGTWLGDLIVDFPDVSGVHLAGASFDAEFHSGLLEGISVP